MTAAPRDITYCLSPTCPQRKNCERWIQNIDSPTDGMWISQAIFNPDEEKGGCFIPIEVECRGCGRTVGPMGTECGNCGVTL